MIRLLLPEMPEAEKGWRQRDLEKLDPELQFRAMEMIIGGRLELVEVRVGGDRAQLVVDADGLLRDLPLNRRASAIYAMTAAENGCVDKAEIRGPALLVQGTSLLA